MGTVFWGLHTPIAAALVRAQGIGQAFETGTYFGFGALQLAALVERVWTVEVDPEFHKFCEAMYGDLSSVNFMTGDSAELLGEFVGTCTDPTLFVLDAHWFPTSPRGDYKPANLCPVMDELAALEGVAAEVRANSAVIVDDTTLFLGSLPRPFVRSSLPSMPDVLARVGSLFECVTVTDDLIAGTNPAGRQAIEEYLTWRDRLGFPGSPGSLPTGRSLP
jgi:hypothetical protein